jgi:hypothetical protein
MFKCPNGSCKPILDIYIPRIFQCYNEHFSPMSCDLYNHSLKIWESIETPTPNVAIPLWGKCEVATHIPEMGTWESYGTPKNSEFDCRGQNTLPWSVLYTVGKVLKRTCWKWPRMGHSDIYNTSYVWKKGQESNWQFDSRPLKVGNRPTSVRAGEMRHAVEKLSRKATSLLQTSSQSKVWARNYELPKSQESKPG